VTVLTLYSRPGCHLCDEMKAVIRKVVGADATIRLDEIDISSNAELEARYGLEIPVLTIEGRKIAKYRVTEADLRRMVRSGNG
jgi:glutaredoxin